MEDTKKIEKPAKAPQAPPKDKVSAAYEAIVKDARTRPAEYVKSSEVPGGGE